MNKFDTARPYTASYLILKKGTKIAFLLRANAGWMNGYYGLPSGKVEVGESFSEAAIREAYEEIGIKINYKDLKFLHAVYRRKGENWVDVYFEALKWKGEVVNAEPHIHSELVWLDPNDLPKNVVPSVRATLKQIAAGSHYSEYESKEP